MSPSPIRCRGSWKIHKRSSEPDRWLDEMGFFRKHTARDSSCLFRAVSENIYNTQRYFHKVRLDCIQFMARNKHLFEGSLSCSFENYLKEMSNPSEWGGLVEISAMSHLYRRDFVIFEANKGPQTNICNGYGDTMHLFYSPETKHFDAVYTKEFINSSSFCQSVVYEILYDGVYHLKDLSYAVDKMLHDKMPSNHIEYFMSENVERRKKQKERAKIFIEASDDDKDKNNNAVALKCKHHTEDLERASLLKESLSIFVFNRSLIQLENVCMNCLNVNSAKDLLDNGITPFPYKVAKALDPDIYRNIEFDVWSELRREMRYGARYSDGTTLQVGVKCLCRLLPDQSVPYHCHIQEMRPEGGPCLVFIEELGEKRLVNYDQLEPLPLDEVRPWAPPYRYSRANSQFLTLSQMLQQIGNITRKQGLSKGRKTKAEEPKGRDKMAQKTKMAWSEEPERPETQFVQPTDFNAYQHLDFLNFEPMPVEVQALPLMVDCRPAAGAPPHELAQSAPNGAPPPPDNHHNQGGEVGTGAPSPGARAPTPAGAGNIAAYTGPPAGYGAPYVCSMKSLVWMAPQSPPAPGAPLLPLAPAPPLPPLPHLPHLPPPPPPVNPHVYKSLQPNGSDLPMNDIPTLRYYFNLGVEYMWATYGAPVQPPRHYAHRDLAQDMQQMSLAGEQAHKHKGAPPAKGSSQRPLLGPRFKRGGHNQDGNQNNNHSQNKGHNNNMGGNKGPNNRRNSHPDSRGPHGYGPGALGPHGPPAHGPPAHGPPSLGPTAHGPPPHGPHAAHGLPASHSPPEECVMEQPMLPMPYIPYPPPVYPIQYYPLESDPSMMGMMGGMGYLGYEDGMEYGGMQAYYPPPHYPPQPPQQPQPHHVEHK